MQPLREHKRKYAVAVGGIFILLAVIGAITVAIFSVRMTARLLDNQRQKTEMEEFLTPVVMFDPAPFESASDIDNQRLLLYSMWETLSDEKVLSYSRSEENFTLLVPASDLEVSARKLFRDKVTLTHESFVYSDSVYFYDAEIASYEVTTSGFLYVYHPEVTEIIKNEDQYEVIVQYIPPDNAWSSIYKGEGSLMGEKIVTYVVEKSDGEWSLLSLKNPSEEGFYQGETGHNVYEAGDQPLTESDVDRAISEGRESSEESSTTESSSATTESSSATTESSSATTESSEGSQEESQTEASSGETSTEESSEESGESSGSESSETESSTSSEESSTAESSTESQTSSQ